MKPVSGPATSESHHPRDTGNSQSAAAANEQEQRLNDEASANYFSSRSRKSSTDFDASTTSPGDETVGAQELRPRTTTLSGVSGPAETAGTCSSRFYGAYDATQDTIPAADLFSEPSTPLEGEQPQSKHRPAALQLNNQKFPSADSIQVGSARHAPPKSPLRQEHLSPTSHTPVQTQSAVPTPTNTHRRTRSSSLPIAADVATERAKARRRRGAKNSVDWSSSSSPSSPNSTQSNSHVTPLSQFQLLTLHQLNLPRPAFLSSNSSSRLWGHAAPKRNFNGSHSSQSSTASNLYTPSLSPPIGLATLKELDLGEILRNPQLRHDIVFDPNLVFRPNFDSGSRGQKKVEASERYWTAVEREITQGCRCTVFSDSGDILPCVCPGTGLDSTALDSLCNRGSGSRFWGKRRSLSGLPIAQRLPSRIGPLVAELRAILLSLLPTPPTNNVFSPSVTDPVGSYELIESVLDPDLIRQEVEHGVLDVASLARFLGSTLRMHCAPMRDDMVDLMVSLISGAEGGASGEHIAQGLQLAFEILEVMKLDIANHQLRTLRPYLLETALEFEIRGCIDYTEKTKGAAVDRTNAWVHEAASRTGASQPFPIVADGLLELVFNTSGFHTLKWDRHAAALTSSQIPHTLLLDLHRIRLFHSDTTDLIVVYMLLMLFRSLAGPNATEAQVDSMTHDIWILLQSNKLVRSAPSSESSSFPSSSSLSRTAKLESASWRKGVQDVLLQIAARAEAVKAGKTDFADISIPDTATINLLQGWMNNNLRPKADLFRLFQSRLREGLQRLVMAEYGSDGSSASSSWWMRSTQHTEATEPEFIPSVPLNWGQCSRASRMQDLTLVSHSSPRSHKRLRDDAEDAMPRKKRKVAATTSDRPASKSEAVELDAFFKRSGLYSLRQEVQALGDRMGKVAAFNVEVWNALYTHMLTA